MPSKDVSHKTLLKESKGVRHIDLGEGVTGWFKPATRSLNNADKVLAMGILGPDEVSGATEATARLPQREIAASILARALVPHLAVDSALAHDENSPGVLLEHVDGNMAADLIGDESFPLINTQTLAKIEPQLADLQAFDFLIGNVDRHVENYMISEGPTVRAIDNDLSFPTVDTKTLRSIPDSKFSGLPSGYTPELKQRLEAMAQSNPLASVAPLIGPAAFDQLKARFDTILADVRVNQNPPEPSSPHLKGLHFE